MINLAFLGTRGLGNYGGFETIVKKVTDNLDYSIFDAYVSREIEQKEEYKLENITKQLFYINQRKTSKAKIKEEVDNVLNEAKILDDIYAKKQWKLDVLFQCASTPGFFMKRPKNNESILLWNPDGLEWKRGKWSFPIKVLWYLSTYFGIRKSHVVTVDSKAIAEEIKYMFRKNQPVYFLPGGTDIIDKTNLSKDVLKDYEVEEKEYYIMVGRAVPENNISEIIEYFTETETKKKLLVIANLKDDPYSKEIKQLIEKSNGKVIYKGAEYNQDRLASLRYFAYGYIHGHSVGGTNPSLLEALGAGNPCICFDVNFNRQVSRESGLYFKDCDSFKKAIVELDNIGNEKWQFMSENAIKIIESDYRWDYITELHEAVAMSSLLDFKKINQEQFDKWLDKKQYKEKLKNNNFNRL